MQVLEIAGRQSGVRWGRPIQQRNGGMVWNGDLETALYRQATRLERERQFMPTRGPDSGWV